MARPRTRVPGPRSPGVSGGAPGWDGSHAIGHGLATTLSRCACVRTAGGVATAWGRAPVHAGRHGGNSEAGRPLPATRPCSLWCPAAPSLRPGAARPCARRARVEPAAPRPWPGRRGPPPGAGKAGCGGGGGSRRPARPPRHPPWRGPSRRPSSRSGAQRPRTAARCGRATHHGWHPRTADAQGVPGAAELPPSTRPRQLPTRRDRDDQAGCGAAPVAAAHPHAPPGIAASRRMPC